jgi:hypothetical protein
MLQGIQHQGSIMTFGCRADTTKPTEDDAADGDGAGTMAIFDGAKFVFNVRCAMPPTGCC